MHAPRRRSAPELALAVLLTLVLAAAGCGKPREAAAGKRPSEAREVAIGVVLPLTGVTTTYGQESKKGIDLAAAEVGARGKVRLRLVYEDDKSDSAEALKAVKKLVSVGGVSAIIGCVASSNTMAAGPEAQMAGIPMISPASTNVDVTKIGPCISRVCFTDPFQGTVMAWFAAQNLKAKTAAILQDRSQDYSKGLAREFRKAFERLGGRVAADLYFEAGDTDFNPYLTKIQELNPDCVYVPAYYSKVGIILYQANSKGLRMPFLGGDGWDSPKLYELAKEGARGNFFSTHFSPEDPDPVVQDFVRKYKEKYGEMPGALAALGYDTVLVLEDALARAAEPRGEALVKAINSTNGLRGVTGVITLDADRNPVKSAVILETQADRAVFKARIEPERNAPKAD